MTASKLARRVGSVFGAATLVEQIAASRELGHVNRGRWLVVVKAEPAEIVRATLADAGIDLQVKPWVPFDVPMLIDLRAVRDVAEPYFEIPPSRYRHAITTDEQALDLARSRVAPKPIEPRLYSRGERLRILNETYRRASIRVDDVDERCDLIDDVLDGLEALPEVGVE